MSPLEKLTGKQDRRAVSLVSDTESSQSEHNEFLNSGQACEPQAVGAVSRLPRSSIVAKDRVAFRGPLDWTVVQGVVIARTSPGKLTSPLWDEFMSEVGLSEAPHVFVMVIGDASISSSQRKEAADVMKAKAMTALVVADSRLSRGIATAMSWMGAAVKPYYWREFQDALGELSARRVARHEVLRRARGLHTGLAL